MHELIDLLYVRNKTLMCQWAINHLFNAINFLYSPLSFALFEVTPVGRIHYAIYAIYVAKLQLSCAYETYRICCACR